jgi:hypothetical protein
MNQITESIVTIAVAIIGLATLAVLVGRNAQTSAVISSAGSAFNSALATAISPVGGGSGFGSALSGGAGLSLSGRVF